ncbi:MAG: hypothetical protein MZW92_43610 [Comamonadaceae bacterium]|nr:hypothetical protein [Comamonadaceae bacterium]
MRLWASLKKTAPSLCTCLLLLAFIKSMDPPTWSPGGSSAFHYIITQPFVMLHYFTTFFVPFGLSADTDWKTLPSLLDFRFLAGVLFLSGLGAIALMTARTARWRPISFGLLWFLITLLPTSLIPLAEVMNDHRLFLPYSRTDAQRLLVGAPPADQGRLTGQFEGAFPARSDGHGPGHPRRVCIRHSCAEPCLAYRRDTLGGMLRSRVPVTGGAT